MSKYISEIDKCKCFEENLELMKKSAERGLPEGATDFELKWEGYSYFLSGDYSPVNPKINCEYRKIKANGKPAKNLTKESISMVASYCCYCGRKLGKSDG